MVSTKTREILFEELSSLIPKLASSRHKGQNGKVGVIGGSFEYTGAPYYGACAALRGGGDLSHIFCTEKAATPIKSYSPEIIVHPYLLSEADLKREAKKEEISDCIESITKWYEPLNAVVMGSGLGRDNAVSACIEKLYSRLEDTVTVCDGDFFWFLSEKNKEGLAEKIKERSHVTILTPNKVEFKRMWDFLKGKDKERTSDDIKNKEKEKLREYKAPILEVSIDNPLVKDQVEIANKLNNVNLLEKGEFDIITNGKEAYVVKKGGCLKRCGGQGDVLAGLTALYGFWDYNRQKENGGIDGKKFNLLKGCLISSYITRYSGAKAYEKYKYGLTTPFLLDELPGAINDFIEHGIN